MRARDQSSSSQDQGNTKKQANEKNVLYNDVEQAYRQARASKNGEKELADWLVYLNLSDSGSAFNLMKFIPDYQKVRMAHSGFKFNVTDKMIDRPYQVGNYAWPGRGNYTWKNLTSKLPGELKSRTLDAREGFDIKDETHVWIARGVKKDFKSKYYESVVFLSCCDWSFFVINQKTFPRLEELEVVSISNLDIPNTISKLRVRQISFLPNSPIEPKNNVKTLVADFHHWNDKLAQLFPNLTELKISTGPSRQPYPTTLKRLHEVIINLLHHDLKKISSNLEKYVVTFMAYNNLNHNFITDLINNLPTYITNLTLNLNTSNDYMVSINIPDTVVEFCCNSSIIPEFTSQSACKSLRLSESDTNVIGGYKNVVCANSDLDVLMLKDKVYKTNKETSKFEFQGLLPKPDFFEADVTWNGKHWSSFYEEIRD